MLYEVITVAVGAEVNLISDAYEIRNSVTGAKESISDWTGYGAAVTAKIADGLTASVRAAYRDGDEFDDYSVGPGVQFQNFYAAYLFGKTKFDGLDADIKTHVAYASYKFPTVMGIDNFDMYLGTSWGSQEINGVKETDDEYA